MIKTEIKFLLCKFFKTKKGTYLFKNLLSKYIQFLRYVWVGQAEKLNLVIHTIALIFTVDAPESTRGAHVHLVARHGYVAEFCFYYE